MEIYHVRIAVTESEMEQLKVYADHMGFDIEAAINALATLGFEDRLRQRYDDAIRIKQNAKQKKYTP